MLEERGYKNTVLCDKIYNILVYNSTILSTKKVL